MWLLLVGSIAKRRRELIRSTVVFVEFLCFWSLYDVAFAFISVAISLSSRILFSGLQSRGLVTTMVLRFPPHPTPHAEETSKLSVIPSTGGPPEWDRHGPSSTRLPTLICTIAN
uniref:Uncharacterized protein n=1 Tax=Cucumis sativus TaxID=3659 RepID=A0A0A0KCG7_CUCSA